MMCHACTCSSLTPQQRANGELAVALILLIIPLVIGIFGVIGNTSQLPNAITGLGLRGSITLMAVSLVGVAVVGVLRWCQNFDAQQIVGELLEEPAPKPTEKELLSEYADELQQIPPGKYRIREREREGIADPDHIILIKSQDGNLKIEIYEHATEFAQFNTRAHAHNDCNTTRIIRAELIEEGYEPDEDDPKHPPWASNESP